MSNGDKIRVTIAAACGAVIFHAFIGRNLGPYVMLYYIGFGVILGIYIEFGGRFNR